MANILDKNEQKIIEAIRSGADSLSLSGHYGRGDVGNVLPKTLLNIPALRHLSLSYFNLDMPDWITDITSLESLEIEEVESVREILPLLWKLERLRKLRLAFVLNDRTQLPSSLAKLKHLEELDIDGAEFEKFPAVIPSLASLQSFSYHYCDCELPEVFNTLSALPRLKKLRLTHYDCENGDFLPESFYQLHALEELHFNQWISLQALPERIGDMQNLRVINLSNDDYQIGHISQIRELPESLCFLGNLQELDLYGLQDLKQFPSNFARLSRLKRLNIMNSGIEELQLTREQWQSMEELRMHGSLPDLRQCINLKKFSWSIRARYNHHNEPHEISEEHGLQLSHLYNLESLTIYANALENMDFLASLTNLRHLHLNCNFERFPAGFEKLKNLEEIRIWYAKPLLTLPEYLGYMPALRKIFLRNCGMKHLPKSVTEREDLHIDIR